jgi:hypothetical protein
MKSAIHIAPIFIEVAWNINMDSWDLLRLSLLVKFILSNSLGVLVNVSFKPNGGSRNKFYVPDVLVFWRA